MTQKLQQCRVELSGQHCPSPTTCGFHHAGAPHWTCFPCNRVCTNEPNLASHCSGLAHEKTVAAARRLGARREPSTPPLLESADLPRDRFCSDCNQHFNGTQQADEHYVGRRHKDQERKLRAKRVDEGAKGGVNVLPLDQVDFGTIEVDGEGDGREEKTIQLFVSTAPKVFVELVRVKLRSHDGTAVSSAFVPYSALPMCRMR